MKWFSMIMANDIREWTGPKFSWHLNIIEENPSENFNQENWPDRGGRNGVWVGFSWSFPFHPTTNFIPPFLHSLISFHFISLAPMIVRQEWSADILAIHWPSSLGPFSPTTNSSPPFLHTHLIHFVSFHFISPCYGEAGMVGRLPCYSLTFNVVASSYVIPRPGPVSGQSVEIF